MSLLQNGTRGLALAGLSTLALGVFAYGTDRLNTRLSSASTFPTNEATATAAPVARPSMQAARTYAAPALDPRLAGADPLTVEPRVPRAAGTPCVVELFRNSGFMRIALAEPFFYIPPAACRGPWSKVVLVLELTGERPMNAPSANIQVTFDNGFTSGAPAPGTLFVGAPQEHAGLPLWRLERDVTDYSALLSQPQTVYLAASDDNTVYEDEYLPVGVRAGKLVFYPATAKTPAPRVPDAVVGLGAHHWWDGSPRASATVALPRNIERAYLDVSAQALGGAARAWFACLPQDAIAAYPTLRSVFALGDARDRRRAPQQGCAGGSFREVEVRIDGRRAGLAPLYPWLPSNLHARFPGSLDGVAPSAQALNFMPFRIDLSPFAALLSDGATHTVEAVMVSGEPAGTAFVSGQLLLFLDHGRAQVTGAVTRNTLADQPAAPQVTSTLAQDGEVVGGTIATRAIRQYAITGYVDTSRGRVHHTVWQRNYFNNVQTLQVSGPDPGTLWHEDAYKHDYLQKVRLSSTIDRVSRSVRGGAVLREDREYVTYPLSLDYRHAGTLVPGTFEDELVTQVFAARVHHGRGLRASHARPAMATYRRKLSDVFTASHAWQRTDRPAGLHTHWSSERTYLYTDSLGGCYSAALTTAAGALTGRTRGQACPNGTNALRWHAHPDGSPDGMGWAAQP